MPEVHVDYGLLRRAASEDFLKMVVAKVRPSRAIRAVVVPRKGVGDEQTVERVYKGLTEMGIRAPCIVKHDQEPAIRALREQIMSRIGGGPPRSAARGEREQRGGGERGSVGQGCAQSACLRP